MKTRTGFLAAILLVLFLFHFEPSHQGPAVNKLLKRLGLLSHRQGHHRPIDNNNNNNLIDDKDDDDDDEDQHEKQEQQSVDQLFESNNILQILRHYVRVVKIIRGANMMLDVRDMYGRVGDYFRTYLKPTI